MPWRNVISQQEPSASAQTPYPPEVHRIAIDDREYILVGTAHISQESVTLVRDVVSREAPDCVCVELDRQRYAALADRQRWEALDLKALIRQRQLSPLLVNLILAAYQQKLGGQLGVAPGAELLEAVRTAQAHDISFVLCDRDVRITLTRAWRLTPLPKKLLLAASLLGSIFDRTTISEDMLRQLRQQDALSALLQELGEALPTLRTVLVDERDLYMAHQLRQVEGQRVVAVMGAAHVEGIRRALLERRYVDLERLTAVPPPSVLWRWARWLVPAVILGALAAIGWQKGMDVMGHNMLFWVLANGIPSAAGALVALAHPLTVLAAFLAAPFTSLTPVIGAGYVTAFVQAYVQPPTVRELQHVSDDVRFPRQWWQNKLLRIFLAFLLPSLGSLIGTWIGGYEILSNLF
jgi:pheromone shutdown-related protein TraB